MADGENDILVVGTAMQVLAKKLEGFWIVYYKVGDINIKADVEESKPSYQSLLEKYNENKHLVHKFYRFD